MNTDIKLILPTTKMGVALDLKQGERLYFLAGPIRGADDWQAKAIELLHQKDPFCYIACPCRYDINHPLSRFQIKPTELPRSTDHKRELPEYALPFENQTMWERYYLEHASCFGSVIFWLPCESKENPRKKEDGPYARDTYGELGRWSIRHASSGKGGFSNQYLSAGSHLNLVIGAEEGFPGLGVIKKNLDADHGQPFDIYPNLEETIAAAVKKGKKTNPQPMNFND